MLASFHLVRGRDHISRSDLPFWGIHPVAGLGRQTGQAFNFHWHHACHGWRVGAILALKQSGLL
jgi:hypothetical protein